MDKVQNFFKKRKRKNVVINDDNNNNNNSSSSNNNQQQPDYAKRSKVLGFNRNNVLDAVARMRKRPVDGDWRKIKSCKIPYTYVKVTWKSGESSVDIFHFCPWGMQEAISRKQTTKNNYSSFQSLPERVKLALELNPDNFDINLISLEASNEGYKGAEKFQRIYCDHCESIILKLILNNEQYGNVESLEELIRNWDVLKVADGLVDIVGCFFPHEEHVNAGPNNRRFILRPCEHPESAHPETIKGKGEQQSKKRKVKSLREIIGVPSDGSSTSKVMAVEKGKGPQKSDKDQKVITGKYGKKVIYKYVGSSMHKNLNVNEPCADEMDKFGKGVCFSMVHAGVNKCLSNNAILENYEAALEAMNTYHSFISTTALPGFEDVTLKPPVAVAVNKNNIGIMERAILDAYINEEGSLYDKIKKSEFWGIMHDGIVKYSKELNGVYLRGVDENNQPFVVPYRLQRMKGGVNAYDLVDALIDTYGTFMNVENNAFNAISAQICLPEGAEFSEIPPKYFKMGSLKEVKEPTKDIHIDIQNAPVGNCGDGVSVNTKAGRLLGVFYGLTTLDYRCSSHASDGTLKRLARSETMCVEQVKSLYNALKTVVKHFSNSVKSKELLDGAMATLGMNEIHLLSWCSTRMGHFLEACVHCNTMLIPIYYTMYSCDLKKEERDNFFAAENIFTMKLMTDVRDKFYVEYLRAVDKTNLLVSSTYNLAHNAASDILKIATPTVDKFLESLKLDENGNMMFMEGDGHELRLSNYHKSVRNQSDEERIQSFKRKLLDLKDEVLENINSNIVDQCDSETNYYTWSGLDLSDSSLTLDGRVERLSPVFQLFTNEIAHVVQKFADKKETKTQPNTWMGYTVHLHYRAVISCSSDELIEEFREAWPSLSQLWFLESNRAMKARKKSDQLTVFKEFICNYATQYFNLCRLILIMICTPANTSPLERGYTMLEMVCTKRRNQLSHENIETLFLLAALKLPRKHTQEYGEEIKLLEQ